MKRYVFLTYTIKDVGGGQLYVATKSTFLKDNGWDVKIIYVSPGDLIIKDFLLFETMENHRLLEPACYYFANKRERILKQIVDFVGNDCDEVVIESHSDFMATWGEMMASELNARHLLYLIAEKLEIRPWLLDFIKFKYERKELASITKDSVSRLLANSNIELTHGSPFLPANGAGNCVQDVDYSIPFDTSIYTIGLVGRMEKEYMRDTTGEICSFLKEHENTQFNIVYIGGGPQGSGIIEHIREQYQDSVNVNLFFIGYVFPLPKCLIKEFDFCIAGAGAATAITWEGVPTIIIDPRSLKSDGVLSVTAKHSIWASDNGKSLGYWMEEVFANRDKYLPQAKRGQRDWTAHMDFIENGSKEMEYNLSFLKYRSCSLLGIKLAKLLLPKSFFYRFSKVTSKLRKK